MQTHQEVDRRSLALHRLVADKIRNDPELFDHAGQTVARWKTIVSVNTQPYIAQWELLIQSGMETCLAAAVEDSEHATLLRKSSPFAGLLTNQERFSFLRAWRAEHAA